MSETDSVANQVTVKVWSGSNSESYDEILDDSPTEYELDVVSTDTYHVPHDEHTVLADHIENHQKYAFYIDTDEVVELVVETSDSHHDPIGAFEQGRPLEGGLIYAPEGHAMHEETPFQVEMWGQIRMRVEETDS